MVQHSSKVLVLLNVGNEKYAILAAQINDVDSGIVDEVPVHEGHPCLGQDRVNKGEVLI